MSYDDAKGPSSGYLRRSRSEGMVVPSEGKEYHNEVTSLGERIEDQAPKTSDVDKNTGDITYTSDGVRRIVPSIGVQRRYEEPPRFSVPSSVPTFSGDDRSHRVTPFPYMEADSYNKPPSIGFIGRYDEAPPVSGVWHPGISYVDMRANQSDVQAPGYSTIGSFLVGKKFKQIDIPYSGRRLDEDRWGNMEESDEEEKIVSCCEGERESFKHKSHHHDLKLTHVLGNNTGTFDRNCSGCLEKLTSSADPHYYYCSICDYSLHKLCATLPDKKQHLCETEKQTEEHELTFKVEPPHEFGQGKCNCCGEIWSNFVYNCEKCKIDVDINCATVGEHRMKHWIHSAHELTLLSREITMECAFCGKTHKGSFFHCTTCEKPNSWIHSLCAQYPKRLKFQCLPDPEHPHQLKLSTETEVLCDLCEKVIPKGPRYTCNECVYNEHSRCEFTQKTKGPKHQHTPVPVSESKIWCSICKELITTGSPRYNCSDKCPYHVHIECAILPPKTTTEVLYADYEENTEQVPNLPFPDNSYSLVKHDFLQLEGKGRLLNRFVHDHKLVLFKNMKDATGVSSSGDLIKLLEKFKLTCKLCGQLITEAPFYTCKEECCINFLLHEWCAKLPPKLEKAPCHINHPLFLQPKYSQLSGSLGLFKCDVCGLWCDGFSFGCDICDFHVDTNCAFLLRNIKNKSHPLHPLRLSRFRTQTKPQKCVACSIKLDDGVFVYQCSKCNFFLHSECSLLPREIKHRYVKDNYKLTYSPSPPPSKLKYFCDICEKDIETKQWFYDCDTCVQSVHAPFAACIKPYNKVLRLIKIGDHPHGFYLMPTKQEGELCSFCTKHISTLPFFKCATCKIAVDSWCVPQMIQKSTEDALTSLIDKYRKLNDDCEQNSNILWSNIREFGSMVTGFNDHEPNSSYVGPQTESALVYKNYSGAPTVSGLDCKNNSETGPGNTYAEIC